MQAKLETLRQFMESMQPAPTPPVELERQVVPPDPSRGQQLTEGLAMLMALVGNLDQRNRSTPYNRPDYRPLPGPRITHGAREKQRAAAQTNVGIANTEAEMNAKLQEQMRKSQSGMLNAVGPSVASAMMREEPQPAAAVQALDWRLGLLDSLDLPQQTREGLKLRLAMTGGSGSGRTADPFADTRARTLGKASAEQVLIEAGFMEKPLTQDEKWLRERFAWHYNNDTAFDEQESWHAALRDVAAFKRGSTGNFGPASEPGIPQGPPPDRALEMAAPAATPPPQPPDTSTPAGQTEVIQNMIQWIQEDPSSKDEIIADFQRQFPHIDFSSYLQSMEP
jgi:hypothetical protein